MYMQNRNRLIGIERKLVITKGEKCKGVNDEYRINRYKLLYIKLISN